MKWIELLLSSRLDFFQVRMFTFRAKLFFRVSWFISTFDFSVYTRKSSINVGRIIRHTSHAWFLQSTGKSFQEFIRTPMSHCSSRRRVMHTTVRLSHPVSWLHYGNARLRFSLTCFIVTSQSIWHKSRFDFNG